MIQDVPPRSNLRRRSGGGYAHQSPSPCGWVSFFSSEYVGIYEAEAEGFLGKVDEGGDR